MLAGDRRSVEHQPRTRGIGRVAAFLSSSLPPGRRSRRATAENRDGVEKGAERGDDATARPQPSSSTPSRGDAAQRERAAGARLASAQRVLQRAEGAGSYAVSRATAWGGVLCRP